MSVRKQQGNEFGAGPDPIGRVAEASGRIVAHAEPSGSRLLAIGDPVFANDLVETVGFSFVSLVFADGSRLDLGRNARALLDEEVFSPAFRGETERVLADVGAFRSLCLDRLVPGNIAAGVAVRLPCSAANEVTKRGVRRAAGKAPHHAVTDCLTTGGEAADLLSVTPANDRDWGSDR